MLDITVRNFLGRMRNDKLKMEKYDRRVKVKYCWIILVSIDIHGLDV
jgi:hypothetical protein